MTSQYLSLATQGRNVWWRYVISIVLIFVFYIIGNIPVGILAAVLEFDQDPSTKLNPTTNQFEGVDPLLPYLVINCVFISLLVGLYIAVRFVHKRKFITLVTPNERMRWKRIFQGFGLYFLLVSVISFVGMVLSPSEYQLTFKPVQFLVFLPFALVLTPIQTSAEELFIRGYLMQAIGLKARNSLIPIMVSSLLFMLIHLANPEVELNLFLMAANYFFYGIFFCFYNCQR